MSKDEAEALLDHIIEKLGPTVTMSRSDYRTLALTWWERGYEAGFEDGWKT